MRCEKCYIKAIHLYYITIKKLQNMQGIKFMITKMIPQIYECANYKCNRNQNSSLMLKSKMNRFIPRKMLFHQNLYTEFCNHNDVAVLFWVIKDISMSSFF